MALVLALAGMVAAWLPGPGMYLAMSLGGMGTVTGWIAYRRQGAPGWGRLAGAGGMTLGMFALLLAGARYGLTWWAVERLTDMLA